jgi:hypothetical protein
MDVDAVFVGTAKVSCDAQDVLEISRQRSIPAIRVIRRLKVGELVSTKDFDSLRGSAAGEHAKYGTCQTDSQHEFCRTTYPILHVLP